jgi:hypothetical protein
MVALDDRCDGGGPVSREERGGLAELCSRADLLQRAKHLFFSAKLTHIPQMGVASSTVVADADRPKMQLALQLTSDPRGLSESDSNGPPAQRRSGHALLASIALEKVRQRPRPAGCFALR